MERNDSSEYITNEKLSKSQLCSCGQSTGSGKLIFYCWTVVWYFYKRGQQNSCRWFRVQEEVSVFHLQVHVLWFLGKRDCLYLETFSQSTHSDRGMFTCFFDVKIPFRGRTVAKLYAALLCRVASSSSTFSFVHTNYLSDFLIGMKLGGEKKYILNSFARITQFQITFLDLQHRSLQEDSTNCCYIYRQAHLLK